MFMTSKITAFKLALLSATLCAMFAYWRLYICVGAAFLLMLIFDCIWAAKVERDHRLSKLQRPVASPPTLKTSLQSRHLFTPPSD